MLLVCCWFCEQNGKQWDRLIDLASVNLVVVIPEPIVLHQILAYSSSFIDTVIARASTQSTRKLTTEGQRLFSVGSKSAKRIKSHYGGGRQAGTQLSTFDAESKSAEIPNSHFGGGRGRQL